MALDAVLTDPTLTREDKDVITAYFYGVLEKDVALSEKLSILCVKKPKPAIRVLLKMGLYSFYYSDTAQYAAIDNAVELTKAVGKRDMAGFVNAVLRKSLTLQEESKADFAQNLSAQSSVPLWIAQALIADYGQERARSILTAKLTKKTHIRRNTLKISQSKLEEKLKTFDKTECGYYVTPQSLQSLKDGEYTVMAHASVKAARYYAAGVKQGGTVLDVCAAPGGKSVYLAENGFSVTACDLHPHRVKLIEKYAERMGVEVNAICRDATVFQPDWNEGFDGVICDVPCSGIGDFLSKPDVLLRRKKEDIEELSRIQYQILQTSSHYVKRGGVLLYSTCTIFKKENDDVVNAFLANNPAFSAETLQVEGVCAEESGAVRLMPDTDGTDGFFVICMRRSDK